MNVKKVLSLFIIFLFPWAVTAETLVEEVRVNNQTVPVKLLVYEQQQPSPTIIVSHGAACVIASDKQWAERIQSWGYNAVIIDHCIVRGLKPHVATVLPSNLQNIDRIKDYLQVIKWIKQQKFQKSKVGLIGFSRGGEAVLAFLNEANYASTVGESLGYSKVIDAAVAYYPDCHDGENGLIQSNVPVITHHGLLDKLAPPSYCVHYTKAKQGSGHKNIFIEEYPGAYHGFDINAPDFWVTRPRGQILVRSYNEEQANRSIQLTKDFFARYLK